MKKFVCKSCNYIYEVPMLDIDDAVGEQWMPPEGWTCPGCGADGSEMVEVKEEQSFLLID